MANELDWLRSKAQHAYTESMIVTDEQATDDCTAGTYQIECVTFKGTIPYRMARALRGSKLLNTATEIETLHLGNGYRGGEGQCRYYRTTYTRVGA